jgi:altronate dehydratase large subunit
VQHWSDGIDVNLSGLIAGEISLEEAGHQVTRTVIDAANGLLTKTEQWGEGQFIMPRLLPAF